MADDITIGSVGVEVVPDARGFGRKTAQQVTPEMQSLGRELGREFGQEIAAPIAPAIRSSVRDGLSNARADGAKGGAEFGGAFADTAKTRIGAALKNLPEAHIGLSATGLDAELAEVRAKLSSLHEAHIGVDMDAGVALAEIDIVSARLRELGAQSPHIDVKVDAAKALVELAAVAEMAKRVGGTDINLGGGGLGAGTSGLNSLPSVLGEVGSGFSLASVGAAVLATALIPIAGLIAGIAASAVLFGTVVVGAFAAAAIGIAPIVRALLALHAADAQSATSATQSASTRANAVAAVQSATASLANTVANADSAAIRSAEAVADARRALANAVRSAQASVTAAVRQQAQAELGLTDAVRSQTEAQAALTSARKDAAEALADIDRQVRQGALDQQQAQLDVQTARQRLQAVNNDPLASTLDRQQAQLDYAQAIERLNDLTTANGRLGDAQADAHAKGIAGADAVVAAQQRLADATRGVATAQQALADAAQHVADAQVQAAEQVQTAQRGVTDALRAQVDQARQSAFAISQAQAAVASAQRSQQQALDSTAGSAAKANAALAGLSPTGRAFVTFLHDEFLPAVKKVISAATDGLAPGLMRALVTLQPVLPAIAADMGKFAGAVGDLAADLAKGLASPGAKRFFNFLADLSGPALSGAGDALRNIASGAAGLLQALEPFAADVGAAIVDLTEKFKEFGNSAGSGGKLDQFVQWLKDNGPGIAKDLADMARALADFAIAAEPTGELVLKIVNATAKLHEFLKPILSLLPGTLEWLGQLNKAWDGTVKALDAVKKAGSDFVGFVRREWSQLTSRLAGPFGDALELIDRSWDAIKTGARAARDYVEGRFDVLVGFVEGLPGRIARASVGMFDGIKDAFRSAINFVIDAWNGLSLKLPSVDTHIPGVGKVGGFELGTPDIPHLAMGGIVTSPTLAMIGEGAGPEAVIPLDVLGEFARWERELGWSQSMTQPPSQGSAAGGPHTVIEQVNITNPVPEPAPVSARRMHDRLEWVLS